MNARFDICAWNEKDVRESNGHEQEDDDFQHLEFDKNEKDTFDVLNSKEDVLIQYKRLTYDLQQHGQSRWFQF